MAVGTVLQWSRESASESEDSLVKPGFVSKTFYDHR